MSAISQPRAVDPFGPTPPPPRAAARRKPIGQVLVDDGLISPDEKLWILEQQSRQSGRFGELVVSKGLLTRPQMDAALARQYRTEVADLRSIPPDMSLLDDFGAARALETGQLPWRRRGGRVIIASARPDAFEDSRYELETLFGPIEMAYTSEAELQHAVLTRHPASLATRAESRLAPENSCRSGTRKMSWLVLGGVVGLIALTGLAPKVVFYILLVWTLLTFGLDTVMKLSAWIVHRMTEHRAADVAIALPQNRLPKVSLLVPLYREERILPILVDRLTALTYPTDLLDICLVVEAEDRAARRCLDTMVLPPQVRTILVPDSPLKTKPRALNYALEFCRGSFIGVYDAEDAPEPDQIMRVVQRFHQAPADVVCLQGALDYYNPHRNWLSRCFTIEYSAWFRVLLPGYLKLGMPIPLGGTTLFFKRPVLEAIGGWDAHNVTEDADLGIRLARHGYRAELLDTTTYEEANCRIWPWIKQRSRWLKGYAVTWAVHTRNPLQLFRDLGAWRFLGVQILFLATITQFLMAPILWSMWAISLGWPHVMSADLGHAGIWAIATVLIVSEMLNLSIRLEGVSRTHHRGLKRWAPSLYAYFPLATVSAFKALIELITRPFYWDKTAHGQFTDDPKG